MTPSPNSGDITQGSLVWVPTSVLPGERELATVGKAFRPGLVLKRISEVARDSSSSRPLSPRMSAGSTQKLESVLEAEVLLEEDSAEVRVPMRDLRPRSIRGGAIAATCDDCTELIYLNDASILENLRLRHEKNLIYTYTANVLLAVNPYKEIASLYGDSQCESYRGQHLGALPPHPYALADTAYRLLRHENRDQAIIVSGESGAGKTETAKIVIRFLAHTSGASSEVAQRVQKRVLESQPILESFGNACTVRNRNSSRFGKYNRIFFDQEGTLVDAGITTYLLESSRVVTRATCERTYHVFYELIAGLDINGLQRLQLRRGQPYCLMHACNQRAEDVRELDAKNFKRLLGALKAAGFEQERVDEILQVLAGILHLGDSLSYEVEPLVHGGLGNSEPQESEACPLLCSAAIQRTSEMLGLDPDELAGSLLRRRIKIPGRESFHEAKRTPQQLRQALHSLVKAIYKRLFERIVAFLNASFRPLLSPSGEEENCNAIVPGLKHIGILDIYGFERLQRNSFEQLCINLANERLQQYFVENVLVAEQALYRREGLNWNDMEIPNSAPVVGCIAQIFATLDDFSGLLASGRERDATDERFCERVLEDTSKDPARREVLFRSASLRRGSLAGGVGRVAQEGFAIKHYAGSVEYSTQGWLDKNNDRLSLECEELFANSSLPTMRELQFPADSQPQSSSFRSISRKYTQDLAALLQTLGSCNLHYIRCFKPNAKQMPDSFDSQLVLEQLVQCGTVELVRIMHYGFPNRCNIVQLLSRFQSLLPERFQRYGPRTFVEALMLAYEIPRSDWALGISRLFLKAGQLKVLEDLRCQGAAVAEERLDAIIQIVVRRRWRRAVQALQFCGRLQAAAANTSLCRFLTQNSVAIIVAKQLRQKLEAARVARAQRELAQRRLRGIFRGAIVFVCIWREARKKRRAQADRGLRLATIVVCGAVRWATIGRRRAAEVSASAQQLAQAAVEAAAVELAAAKALEAEAAGAAKAATEAALAKSRGAETIAAQALAVDMLAANTSATALIAVEERSAAVTPADTVTARHRREREEAESEKENLLGRSSNVVAGLGPLDIGDATSSPPTTKKWRDECGLSPLLLTPEPTSGGGRPSPLSNIGSTGNSCSPAAKRYSLISIDWRPEAFNSTECLKRRPVIEPPSYIQEQDASQQRQWYSDQKTLYFKELYPYLDDDTTKSAMRPRPSLLSLGTGGGVASATSSGRRRPLGSPLVLDTLHAAPTAAPSIGALLSRPAPGLSAHSANGVCSKGSGGDQKAVEARRNLERQLAAAACDVPAPTKKTVGATDTVGGTPPALLKSRLKPPKQFNWRPGADA